MTLPERELLLQRIRSAALDASPVSGLTHRYYKYPARFSPKFVSAVIEAFSNPGNIVLDPYMGGGTTIVEAMAAGRQAIGCDLNSLAIFVARAKTSFLAERCEKALLAWANDVVPSLSYFDMQPRLAEIICEARTRNLNVPRAKAIKKFIALALLSIEGLPSQAAQDVARCALLSCSQWALNGKRSYARLPEFRERLSRITIQAVEDAATFTCQAKTHSDSAPTLILDSASRIRDHMPFCAGAKADLVVTSPPYPGVHILYHRWQVDGRRESPAPYWIANCLDGQGESYYTFGSRKDTNNREYFRQSLDTLSAIRSVMKDGAVIAQVVAFSDPNSHLRRYLKNMEKAGFSEVKSLKGRAFRTWRDVPGRSWHATLKGKTNSAREVVLLHVAS